MSDVKNHDGMNINNLFVGTMYKAYSRLNKVYF